ncbi:MAG: glycosyltransferase [Candidatus Zixiibacteriota bacterium]
MNEIFDYFLITGISIGIIYTILETIFLTVGRKSAGRKLSQMTEFPPVTVLKPLKGIDGQLIDNLRSFFEIDYPEFELIFGVNDADDPAIMEVRKLQREYPEVESRLIVNEFRIGANPKVNNLYNMNSYVKYNHLVISDSNVRVDNDYIRQLVSEMDSPKVGLVTSIIRGVDATGFGSLFENLHLNTFVAANVFSIKKLFKIPITIGKSMLFRRETLNQIGGFEALSQYLAEDFMIGQMISGLGLEIRESASCINAVNSGWKFGRFTNRHLRWATMRRHINVWNYSAEIFSNPVFFALLYLIKNPQVYGVELFASVYLTKSLIDYIGSLSMNTGERWYHYLLTPIKDLAIAGIWFMPFFNYMVNWRGNCFIVSDQTKLTKLPSANIEIGLTAGEIYYTAFKEKTVADNLTPVQRLFWFTGMAGRLMLTGTRRIIARLG